MKLVLYLLVLLSSALALARALMQAPQPPRAAQNKELLMQREASMPSHSAIGTGSEGRSAAIQAVAGAVTGFGSALTGTSGPVLSMPQFLLLRWPVRMSLGSAQAVQLPIASASILCYTLLRPGVICPELAAAITLGLAPSVAVGAVAAHHVAEARLKLVVSAVLVLSSLVLCGKLLLEELGGKEDSSSSSSSSSSGVVDGEWR